MNFKKPEDLVAKALRQYAAQIMHRTKLGFPVPVEEARDLDRALRSCDGISDIDRVWMSWRYNAESHGWLTTEEIVTGPSSYRRGYRETT